MQQIPNAIGSLVSDMRKRFRASMDHQTADVIPCQNRGAIIGYGLTASLGLALDDSVITFPHAKSTTATIFENKLCILGLYKENSILLSILSLLFQGRFL